VLDGGSREVSGHIINVSGADASGSNPCGSLVINSGVTVRNYMGVTPKSTTLTMYGGAVNNGGSTTVNGGTFSDNVGYYGGGISGGLFVLPLAVRRSDV